MRNNKGYYAWEGKYAFKDDKEGMDFTELVESNDRDKMTDDEIETNEKTCRQPSKPEKIFWKDSVFS